MKDTRLLQLVLDKISNVDKKVDALSNKINNTESRITKRLDALGLHHTQ